MLRSSALEVPWEMGWFKPLNTGVFVRLHQNHHPEMIIRKLEVVTVTAGLELSDFGTARIFGFCVGSQWIQIPVQNKVLR